MQEHGLIFCWMLFLSMYFKEFIDLWTFVHISQCCSMVPSIELNSLQYRRSSMNVFVPESLTHKLTFPIITQNKGYRTFFVKKSISMSKAWHYVYSEIDVPERSEQFCYLICSRHLNISRSSTYQIVFLWKGLLSFILPYDMITMV